MDYIVLHKLPNGEGLNLENLRKYDMGGIQSGKMPEEKEDQADMDGSTFKEEGEEEEEGEDKHRWVGIRHLPRVAGFCLYLHWALPAVQVHCPPGGQLLRRE